MAGKKYTEKSLENIFSVKKLGVDDLNYARLVLLARNPYGFCITSAN